MADLVGPLLGDMLASVQAALTKPVGRAQVSPGASVAWDDCCSGQLWVRLISLVPGSVNTSPNCAPLWWLGTVGVGILRCAATLSDAGVAPTPAVLTAEATAMAADAHQLSNGIQNAMSANSMRMTMTRWDPLGPEGGCCGGEWQITLAVNNIKE